jgi:hypothetical protein
MIMVVVPLDAPPEAPAAGALDAVVVLLEHAAIRRPAKAITITERHRIEPARVTFTMLCPSSPVERTSPNGTRHARFAFIRARLSKHPNMITSAAFGVVIAEMP